MNDSENQETKQSKILCLNCGSQLVGEYCHQCGQQHITDRISLRLVMKWFAQPVLNLERGIGLTLFKLFIDPGNVAKQYIAGQRKKYTNPFVYIFLWTALSLIVNAMMGSELRGETRNLLKDTYVNLHFFSASQLEAVVDLSLKLDTYSAQIIMLLSVPISLLLRWGLRKKTSYNLAEIFIFTIFIFGQLKFIEIFLSLFIYLFHLDFGVYLYTYLFLAVLAFLYGGSQFFGRGLSIKLRIIASCILGYLFFSLAQVTILFAFVLLIY